jgi:phosphoribosyl 1,2-cyclic phosphodiesterase
MLEAMARITVLASGSKGNSTVVASSRTRILVDAGLSCRELLKRMRECGEDPAALDAILITHEHQDHVQGVAVLARKLGVPVYFTEMTHRAWMRWMTPQKRMTYAEWLERRKASQGAGREAGSEAAQEEAQAEMASAETERDPCALPEVGLFSAGQPFTIGDIGVLPFTIPHDAADPVGFVFTVDGARFGIATDLGYMTPNAKQALRGCDVLMLESNHDTEMLRDGPYPWSVKQRVMSRVGHLSNEAAAEFLERGYDGQARYVILAHLSECNNLPGLARICAERALRDRMNLLANELVVAEQGQPIAPICL